MFTSNVVDVFNATTGLCRTEQDLSVRRWLLAAASITTTNFALAIFAGGCGTLCYMSFCWVALFCNSAQVERKSAALMIFAGDPDVGCLGNAVDIFNASGTMASVFFEFTVLEHTNK